LVDVIVNANKFNSNIAAGELEVSDGKQKILLTTFVANIK
jgi:hypothetical protein